MQSIATLEEGDLASRELELNEAISVPGHTGSWRHWILFGGRKETLWTTYMAEPNGEGPNDIPFVKSAVPKVAVQVIDFAAAFYSTATGQKRIDSVAQEILRLRDLKSENVMSVYAVKREKSPKGWERLILVTEAVVDGTKLSSWLPKDGFAEMIARVSSNPKPTRL